MSELAEAAAKCRDAKARWHESRQRRNEAIRTARADGYGVRQLAEVTGLSTVSIVKICADVIGVPARPKTEGAYYRRIRHEDVDRAEHRVVMEQMIGRPLFPEETVHHKNGVRNDNRPENLELWASRHPPGQRVEDLVAFAYEILDLYEGRGAASLELIRDR